MKKIKIENKLSLNKERVSTLNDAQMSSVNGGKEELLSISNRCSHSGSACGSRRCTKQLFCNPL